MSEAESKREHDYDTNGWYDDPEQWPDEGTDLRELVDYLRSSTDCAAISIHYDEEGKEHASYYGKRDAIGGGVLKNIRDAGFFVSLAGKDETPSETRHNSWVSDGHEDTETSWIEFKRR